MKSRQMVPLRSVQELEVGDIVRHKTMSDACVVVAHHGDRAIAVRAIAIMNPNEWLVMREQDRA